MKRENSIFALVVVLLVALQTADSADPPKACEPGSWGSPCKKCDCGDRATACDNQTGKCFCNTKGLIGDKCDQCDEKKRYKGDAVKDTCYYDIDESINYNFKLIGAANANVTKLNLKLTPEHKNENIHMKITCIDNCNSFDLRLIAKEHGKPDKIILNNKKMNAKEVYEKIMLAKDFQFGVEKGKPLTEFIMHFSNFKTPIGFEVNAIPESKLKEKMGMTMNES